MVARATLAGRGWRGFRGRQPPMLVTHLPPSHDYGGENNCCGFSEKRADDGEQADGPNLRWVANLSMDNGTGQTSEKDTRRNEYCVGRLATLLSIAAVTF